MILNLCIIRLLFCWYQVVSEYILGKLGISKCRRCCYENKVFVVFKYVFYDENYDMR